MSTFKVNRGQFWLDDQPVLIQAGEFHYFRTPVDQWRRRLEMLQASGFNAVAAYIPWLWHEPSEGVFDVGGHSHPMRDLAGFLDLATEMGFWIIARPGPYIMAETHNEGIPGWLFANHPKATYIDQNDKPTNLASYLHPEFLACASRWYRAVFAVLTPRQITHGGRIIMIQLDNEMGMAQWVRNLVDVNTDTLTRLVSYLEATHGPALASRYAVPPTPQSLKQAILEPHAPDGRTVIEDYRRFYRLYLREYTQFLLAESKACGMDVPPVINIHGFGNGGKTFPIGLSQLIDVLELDDVVSATDVYPIRIDEGNFNHMLLVNEMTRALQNPQQALFSIEFQAGGNNDFGGFQASLPDLHTRLCLSTGMRAINHYLFFDGENLPELSSNRRHDWGHPVRKDGTPRRHFPRYARLSRVLNAYGRALVEAQPEVVTTVGFVLDQYMTEVNNALTRPETDALTQRRDVALFDMLGRGLALTHRAFDAMELSRATLDPARTPVLWVMMARPCSAAVQQKLVEYVGAGGRLVLAGGMCVEDLEHGPCTLLKDALGITSVDAPDPAPPSFLRVFDHDGVPVGFYETYAGEFDEVFATDPAGRVVGFTRALGRGTVVVLGSAVPAYTLDDLDVMERIAQRVGCPSPFTLSDWADVRLSSGPAGSFVYLNNYQDDPIETTVSYRGQALFGGRAVHIPARQGAILPLDWRLNADVTIHFATSEIVSVQADAAGVRIATALKDCVVELTAPGLKSAVGPADQRVTIACHTGVIELTRGGRA